MVESGQKACVSRSSQQARPGHVSATLSLILGPGAASPLGEIWTETSYARGQSLGHVKQEARSQAEGITNVKAKEGACSVCLRKRQLRERGREHCGEAGSSQARTP